MRVADAMPLDLLLVLLTRDNRPAMLRSWVFAHSESVGDDDSSLEATARWLESSRLRLLRQAVVAMDQLRSEANHREPRVEAAVAAVLRAFPPSSADHAR